MTDTSLIDDAAAGGPGEVVLRAHGIGKSFFGVSVLEGIDLDIRRGEVHGLVGENGAGKSTLMKILAGVHVADAGTVEFEGRKVAFTHPIQAYTGILGLESFTGENATIAVAASVWRPLAPSQDALAERSLSYLQSIRR